jgi:hypothetical protein
MTAESEAFEQLTARIQNLVQGTGATVQRDPAAFADPASPDRTWQIDVLITRGNQKTFVECRFRNGRQDVMWIEELIGRKLSLRLDGMVAVSHDGFTPPAKIKAKHFGIALFDHENLTDAEIASWASQHRLNRLLSYSHTLKSSSAFRKRTYPG